MNAKLLANILHKQASQGCSPAAAIAVVWDILQQEQQTSQEIDLPFMGNDNNTQATMLAMMAKNIIELWPGLTLVEYARLLKKMSKGSVVLLGCALCYAVKPTPPAIKLCGALLDAEVYPNTDKEEMRCVFTSCECKGKYSEADIVAALQHYFPSVIITFDVQADKPWQNTGVHIKATEKAIINYQSGTWYISPSVPNCDAEGNYRYIAKTGYAMQYKPEGGLIGRIGTEVFWVGAHCETPPGAVGELQLCPNDDLDARYGCGLRDNSGSLKVSITVKDR